MPSDGGGIVKNFDSRTYSINDFVEWYNRKQLELSPRFQRRPVWNPRAKAYLIDTIIRGKPIPKVFIRSHTNPDTRITIREIVDGQQRLRAIIDFLNDGFRVSKVHNQDFGGKLFSELPKEVQTDFLNYEISVDLLIDLEDADILDIFARLNAYSVQLNRQELLNAKFFGHFKTLVYELSYEYTSFWEQNKVFSNNNIVRMQEAALTSDIVASMVENTLVDSKNMEKIYRKYDDVFQDYEITKERFINIMDYIGSVFDGSLAESNFKRQPLFFSLFMTIYHMQFGITEISTERIALDNKSIPRFRGFVNYIDSMLLEEKAKKDYSAFFDSISKATTDQRIRYIRTSFLCKRLIEFFTKN